jgi:hypothetical protein
MGQYIEEISLSFSTQEFPFIEKDEEYMIVIGPFEIEGQVLKSSIVRAERLSDCGLWP